MAAQGGTSPNPSVGAPAVEPVNATTEPTLFARTTTFQSPPAPMSAAARSYICERLLPAIRQQRGFVRGTWLYDPASGKATAIIVYESEGAMREGEVADRALVAQIHRDFGVPAPTQERFEVVATVENRPLQRQSRPNFSSDSILQRFLSRFRKPQRQSRPNFSFDDAVNHLSRQICLIPADKRDDWCKSFYQSYTQRFISDNTRIWATGSILIPLSLGGFVALLNIHDATFIHVLLLALISISLIVLWSIIAENHRAFQEKSMAWLVAIEKRAGIVDAGLSRVMPNGFARFLVGERRVRQIRWWLSIFIVVGWFLLLIFYALGKKPF